MSEETLSQIMQTLVEVRTTQNHLVDDFSEMKQDIKEIKKGNDERDKLIKDLEISRANSAGEKKIVTGVISACVAAVSAIVTGVIMWLINGGNL